MRARFDFPAHGRPVLFEQPSRVLVAHSTADVVSALTEAEEALRQGRYIAGWVAYEAASAFDDALVTKPPSPVPLVCLGVFASMREAPPLDASLETEAPAWTPALDRDTYQRDVGTIREAIANGDTYQINYTFRLQADVPSSTSISALYSRLAAAEQVPYAALIEVDDRAVLSLSPELFFERDGDRLTTKPMKGTAPRGRWVEEDEALGAALQVSTKNRAENVMIVDLCRNDLTRVCDVGTVQATSLFEVQRYSTVWQMVSTVEGRLRRNAGLVDIFRALFPAGSITGAPKSSSMRLIAELEHAPRGVYCGAIGYATPDGRATFNVGIRTLTMKVASGRAEYGVGGGITWDSTAPDEYAEALQKAACLELRPPFALFETLRWDAGGGVRLDAHVRRLRASAEYFGFPVNGDPVDVIATVAQARYRGSPLRVKLKLDPSGQLSATSEQLDATPDDPAVALALSPVDSRSRWLFHKTTRREVYESHAAAHPGVWDVLLWNERRDLTEFTRGNVVLELDGRLVTPARESGLLPGVFRQALLDAGEIVERVVTVDDLPRATRAWFVNSLRERVPVRVVI